MNKAASAGGGAGGQPFEHRLSEGIGWLARLIRTIVQALLALAAIAYIFVFAVQTLMNANWSKGVGGISVNHTALFDCIGGILGISAAVDLAYMLTTEGPDEAIGPLTLSISAAAIIVLGNATTGGDLISALVPYVVTLICCISILILFAVRRYLLNLPEKESGSHG